MPYIALAISPEVKWNTLAFLCVVLCLYGLYWLFDNNRLFFWCVAGALAVHLMTVGTIYTGMGGSILLTLLVIVGSVLIFGGLAWLLVNNLLLFSSISASTTIIGVCLFALWFVNKVHEQNREVRIEIAAVATETPPPPKPTATPPPEATPPPQISPKQGQQDSKHDIKQPPKGNPKVDKSKPIQQAAPPRNSRILATRTDTPDPSLPTVPDPDNGSYETHMHDFLDHPGTNPLGDVQDTGTGTTDGPGDPHGVPGIPKGFSQGKGEGNKLYLIRLRYGNGSSAWNKNGDGLNQLLRYLNTYIPCEPSADWMDAAKLRDKYLANHEPPTFLYMFMDETATLTAEDVKVLQQYLRGGGFLFVDSGPSSDNVENVRTQIGRVVPEPLERLSNDHPIYRSFLFSLKVPPIGNNFITRVNYGATRNNKLIVFYTPGNFAAFYGSYFPGSGDDAGVASYIKATFQMGGNVVSYALNHGDPPGGTRQGADASVNAGVLKGFMGDDTATLPSSAVSGASQRGARPIKTPAPHEDLKDEVPDAPRLVP